MKKMGKSLGNAIYLIDNEETIKKKVMGAVTDKNKIKKTIQQTLMYVWSTIIIN